MSKAAAGLSLLSSIGASLCCITPLLTLVSGTSGIASGLSWIEPVRPYFIGLSVFLIGFAWYQKFRPRKKGICDCVVVENRKFLSSTGFLVSVTLMTILLLTFPFYSGVFYPIPKTAVISTKQQSGSIKRVEFSVKGMGCDACEPEVETAVAKIAGIRYVKASYKKKNAVVTYDSTLISSEAIRQAINQTGYTAQNVKY